MSASAILSSETPKSKPRSHIASNGFTALLTENISQTSWLAQELLMITRPRRPSAPFVAPERTSLTFTACLPREVKEYQEFSNVGTNRYRRAVRDCASRAQLSVEAQQIDPVGSKRACKLSESQQKLIGASSTVKDGKTLSEATRRFEP